MSMILSAILGLLAVIVAVTLVVLIIVFLIVPILRAGGAILSRIFGFLASTLRDIARSIGAMVAAVVLSLLCVGAIIIGRWSVAAHYGRAVKAELAASVLALYRLILANPLRLFGLEGVTEGLERRVPHAIAQAPLPEPSASRRAAFDGYSIVGTLPGGGSGAKLYIAQPDPIKRAAFARSGLERPGNPIDQVVIKSFSIDDGSELPQIVREGRALDAAKRLGLILDDALTAKRFHYVMRYVPGESLTAVTRRMHAASGPEGLSTVQTKAALAYLNDLLETLASYHSGGLWHKDVKPDNIIVHARTGKAHLVDFGLLGSLSSAMTLTTHGTEYFRDAEMVRLATKGVKVHQVDGTRFDVYGAGAVLYAMIEDGFPPHGGLSQVTRRCPEAARWIIRRSMAQYDRRYASAAEMLADVRVLLAAPDPFAVRPIDLPSVRRADLESPLSSDIGSADTDRASRAGISPDIAARIGPAAASPLPRDSAARPRVTVTNWWTGKRAVTLDTNTATAPAAPSHAPAFAAAAPHPGATRRSAAEQLDAARQRIASAQARAADRARRMRPVEHTHDTGPNAGVAAAIIIVAVASIALYMGVRSPSQSSAVIEHVAAAHPANQTLAFNTPTINLAPGGTAAFRAADLTDLTALTPLTPLTPLTIPAAANTPTTLAHSTDVLVVVDALPPWNDAVSTAVSGVRQILADAGASPRGLDHSPASLTAPLTTSEVINNITHDAETDLLAAARVAMGSLPADAPITAHLDARGYDDFFRRYPDIGAVLWIQPTKDGVATLRVVASPRLAPADAHALALHLGRLAATN
jgi:hypothetical protein